MAMCRLIAGKKNPGLVHFLRAHGFVVSCDNLKPRVDFIPVQGRCVGAKDRVGRVAGNLLVGLWVVVLCGILFFALLLVILSEECQVKEEKCSEPSGNRASQRISVSAGSNRVNTQKQVSASVHHNTWDTTSGR